MIYRTKQDMSALLTAVTRDKPKLVDMLLKNGVTLNLKSKNNVSYVSKYSLLFIFLVSDKNTSLFNYYSLSICLLKQSQTEPKQY